MVAEKETHIQFKSPDCTGIHGVKPGLYSEIISSIRECTDVPLKLKLTKETDHND